MTRWSGTAALRLRNAGPKLIEGFLPSGAPNWWVVRWIVLAGMVGGSVAVTMLWLPMKGSPRVFIETWSDGVVVFPTERIDIAAWARPASGPGAVADSPPGLNLGTDSLGSAYLEIAGHSLPEPYRAHASVVGGFVRSFGVEGRCQVRIGLAQRDRVEVLVQPLGSASPSFLRGLLLPPDDKTRCTVDAELDPTPMKSPAEGTTEWGAVPEASVPIPPRDLGPSDRVRLRFQNAVPGQRIAAGRFGVGGIGFRSPHREQTASLIQGGLLRLVDFQGDGDAQVRVLDRVLGRGHPIQRGDQLELGTLDGGQVLGLEIGELIHTQVTGKASDPRIARRDLEPRLLRQLNEQNALVWIASFVLGAMGIVASIIRASR